MFKGNKVFSSFSVNDLDEAQNFYSKTLGLNVSKRSEGLNIELSSGGKVFIYPKDDHEPATFTILNFMVADIEKTVDQLTEKGIKFENYDGELKTDEKGIFRGHGPTIAWFKDPAGNFLSIIQDDQ